MAVAQAALDCTQAIDLAQDGSSGGMDETIAQAVEQRSATIAGAEATLQDGEAGAELAAVTLWYNQTQGGWRAYPATATPGNIPTQNAWAAYQLAVAQDRDTYVQAAAAANLSQATTIAEAVQTQSVSYAQAEQTRADTIAQQQFDRVAGGGSETGNAPAEETCLAGEISDELTEQQADDLASDQKMDGYAAADQGYSSNVDAATAAQQTAKGNAEGQLSLADDAAFVVETAAWAGWQPPNPGDPQGSQGPNPYQVYEQTCATNQQAYLAALDTGEYHDALAMISASQTRAVDQLGHRRRRRSRRLRLGRLPGPFLRLGRRCNRSWVFGLGSWRQHRAESLRRRHWVLSTEHWLLRAGLLRLHRQRRRNQSSNS